MAIGSEGTQNQSLFCFVWCSMAAVSVCVERSLSGNLCEMIVVASGVIFSVIRFLNRIVSLCPMMDNTLSPTLSHPLAFPSSAFCVEHHALALLFSVHNS